MKRNRTRIFGMLLAVMVLVTSVPSMVSASNVTIKGSSQTKEKKTKEATTKEEESQKENEVLPEGEYGSPEEGKPYNFTGVEPIDEKPEDFERYEYDPMEKEPALMAVDEYQDLTANIFKRVEWTDKTSGNGKVTLNYSSNSGSYSGTEDMNVVLVQDKSGSMNPNYGFQIALDMRGLNMSDGAHWWYPIRNSSGFSEAAIDCTGDNYMYKLNESSSGMLSSGLIDGFIKFNAPSQDADGRYFYLMIKGDVNSPSLSAGQMVHGNNLYNISNTDLHSYYKLDNREEALGYLAAGRRVIRCSNWVNMYKDQLGSEQYFLDMSQVYEFNGQQILRTCNDEMESTSASRLAKTQWFFDKLVGDIKRLNTSNKIAYVPFWGDVPNNGSWSNASSGGSSSNLYEDTDPDLMKYKEGVSYLGFTNSANFGTITNQINHPFTYQGTNWARALQRTVDLLNNRSAEDKQKKTLVVFVTDGMPQGTAGSQEDLNNPYINGESQIRTLKGMSGVNVYGCGVGINRQDDSVRSRIDNVDSSGRGQFAQYVHEFDKLYSDILARINSDFYVKITGDETFYTDKLSGSFALDESKLDGTWKVLASPGAGTTKGVPTDVYNVVKNNGGITKVYVRSTKAVYWYIGSMTDGGYSASGHSINFPIQYADYQASTKGADVNLAANTEQKLTFVPSTNKNTIKTVTLTTPNLVFNREDAPTITINKTLDGSRFTTDQSYRFAYCKNKQSGKVVSSEGNATVTVKAGQLKGSTVISNVQPGTYYVYEVDASNTIVSSQVGTATVGMTPSITTKAKGGGVPASATTTDGTNPANQNNYLQIVRVNATVEFTNYYVSMEVHKTWDDSNSSRRPASVTVNLLKNGAKVDSKKVTADMDWKYAFENLDKLDATGKEISYTVTEEPVKDYEEKIQYTSAGSVKKANIKNTLMVADLTVVKTIPSDADTIWWDHGEPTFMVKVSGKGLDGKDYTFYHTFVFDKDYVTKNAKDGKVSLSYTFKDIPNSTDYKCEEMTVSRWQLESMQGNGDNVKVTKGKTEAGMEYFATYANANVKEKPEGTTVTFVNAKDDYQWFNHITSVKNVIKE